MSNETAVSIIIPFLNEEDGIDVLYSSINQYYGQRKFEFEIIFVDDGSTDRTAELIRNKTALPYSCKLISLSKNFGAHAAVRAGFTHAKGNYATALPADLQIGFDTVERLYEAALQGNDSVYGVREVNEIGFVEKTFSRFYASMMQRYVNKDFPFKGLETVLISRKVLNVLNAHVESNSSFILQVMSMGFKHIFVNIEKKNRSIGRSKWTVSKKVKLFIDSFVAFSYAPIRFVTVLGILLFIMGLVWSGYIIVRKIAFNDIVQGWTALMSILLTGFGITNISLGIIAEYLWRTLDSSRRRPVFIIDEITELEKNG